MKVLPSPYAALLARTAVQTHRIVVDGAEVSYWEYGTPGDGPTLVFVHGFRGDHHGLEPVVAFLPGVHIVAPDLPGFGRSEPLGGAHSIANLAVWLRDFTDALGLTGRAVLLGHSFGTIVVSAAVAGGLPTPKAILVNPIAAPALQGPNAVGTRLALLYYRVGALLPERAGGALLKSRIVTRGSSIFLAKTRNRSLRAWIHNQHDRFFGGYASRRVVLEAFQASVEHDVSEYAARIAVPVTLIAAEHDDITALADVRRLVGLFPDASLHVIGDVGHLVHYEKPAEAARAIAGAVGLPGPC